MILHNSYFELTWRMDMHNEFACSKAFHYEKNTISAIKKAMEKGLSRFLGMDFFFSFKSKSSTEVCILVKIIPSDKVVHFPEISPHYMGS